MAFSVNGLMSGLDTASLISQMMTLERRPVELLQLKVTEFEAKISAVGMLKSALSDLKSAAGALTDTDLFAGFKATSANTEVLTATASDGAVSGTYQVAVTTLAQAQTVKGGNFAASDTVVGTGTLTIQMGTNAAVNVAIDSTNNTLAGIAQAINDSDAEVTAGVVNDGLGNYFLSLTGKETGTANTISLSIDDDDLIDDDANGLSKLYAVPATQTMTTTQPAANAALTVNGIDVERASNTIDDLLEGVTLSLVKADAGNPVTVGVARDTDSIKSKINAFVSKYNTVVGSLSKLQSYDAETGVAGLLQGDSTTRNVQGQLRLLVQGEIAGVAENVNQLSELGFELGRDGKLTFDGAIFDEVYSTNRADVINAFAQDTDSAQGFAVQLEAALENYVQSTTGILSAKEEGLQNSVDRLGDQIERYELRLAKREENLRRQFESLETLLAQFQATSGTLTQQLESLSNLSAQIAKNTK